MPTSSEVAPPPVPPRAALFAALAFGYFLSYFLRSANAVLAPSLQSEVGLTPADLGFMTGTFFAAYAAVQLPVGVALDRFGPRWVAGGLIALGVVGCALFAIGTTLTTLTAARVLLGVGLGSVLLAGLKAFSLWWPSDRYATISGIYFATGSLGALAAATPLALLEAAVGWRTVFALAAVVVLVAGAGIVALIPKGPRPGADALAAPRGAVAPRGPSPPPVERTTPRRGDLARVMALSFCTCGPLLTVQTLWGGPLLFDLYGYDPVAAGNLLLLLSLGVTVGYGISGALADRYGLFATTAVALFAFALTQAALLVQVEALLPFVYPLFGIAGGHCVLGLANARRLLGTARTGRATGAVNAAGIGGVFVLQWVTGLIVGAAATPSLGFGIALGAMLTLTLVAWALYLPLRPRLAVQR